MSAHLIKNGQVVADSWQKIEAALEGERVSVPEGQVLLPVAVWQAQRDVLAGRAELGELGLWLEPADELSAVADDLGKFAVIAIHFPKFVDGRGYSLARLLRERYGFTGEIRAVGDVLHDQLYFMARVGFDAFALRGDKNLDLALSGAFKTFSNAYQTGVDRPQPLFRRRVSA